MGNLRLSAEKVKGLMLEYGIGNGELAEAIGYHPAYLSRIINGGRCSREALRSIAGYFEVSEQEITDIDYEDYTTYVLIDKNRVRLRMHELGVNYRYLSNKSGYSENYIKRKIRSGETAPEALARSIADALELEYESIINRKGEMEYGN